MLGWEQFWLGMWERNWQNEKLQPEVEMLPTEDSEILGANLPATWELARRVPEAQACHEAIISLSASSESPACLWFYS